MKFYMKKRYLLSLLIILSIVSLFVGVGSLTITDILTLKEDKIQLLMISRMPRLISIIVAGAGLGISGLIMQQISRNKFVSPTTAATSDFAKLGILVGLIAFGSSGQMTKMIIAFIFSMVGTVVFMKMIKAIQIKNIIFVPLVGMMLGKIVGSVTSYFAYILLSVL